MSEFRRIISTYTFSPAAVGEGYDLGPFSA
jgi:hypothetical protein